MKKYKIFVFIVAVFFFMRCYSENQIKIVEATNNKGLVQLWQVVPDGQQNKEGKTTSEIMNVLKCRPNHTLYPNGGKSSHTTYVNSCYVDDALYLGEDTNYYYIYLSGYEGKVPKKQSHTFELDLNSDGKKVTYEIQTVAYYIPAQTSYTMERFDINEKTEALDVDILNYSDEYLNKYDKLSKSSLTYSNSTVQSPSYYANESGDLVHYITNNVTKSGSYSKVIVGKAPSWMKQSTKYYSYDGIYFYTNWRYIDVEGKGAVNQNTPYYNYYQYLPFRSRTNYTANKLDDYTKTNVGTQGKLVGTGKYFYAVQDSYGINGALQYAMGIHESGWGKSSIVIRNNNLFGINAVDADPSGSAQTFKTIEDCINVHAQRYISWGYTDPIGDYRYYGAHVGNKGSGMNVSYASDPFWGEKIAGWYYRFDKANGLKDYNYYTIGIKQSNATLNVNDVNSKLLYQTKNKYSNKTIVDYPILIVGKKSGLYRIKTDTPIVNGVPKFSAQYVWEDTYGYVNANYIYISNHTNYVDPKPIAEDINKDGFIDKSDIDYIAQFYGTKNTLYDLNKDGIVDIYDKVQIANKFE